MDRKLTMFTVALWTPVAVFSSSFSDALSSPSDYAKLGQMDTTQVNEKRKEDCPPLFRSSSVSEFSFQQYEFNKVSDKKHVLRRCASEANLAISKKEILPDEGKGDLKFVSIKFQPNARSGRSDTVKQISQAYKEHAADRVYQLATEYCNGVEDFEARKFPMSVYLSICARLYEEGLIDAYWLPEYFCNSRWQPVARELFTYKGKAISEGHMYAVGIYLSVIGQYKDMKIEPRYVSPLYRKALKAAQSEYVWPQKNLLSWAFRQAYNDKETQKIALEVKPLLFFE